VSPTAPTFDTETGVLTITDTTGVVYTKLPSTVVNASGSPYAPLFRLALGLPLLPLRLTVITSLAAMTTAGRLLARPEPFRRFRWLDFLEKSAMETL
jgi:hypothetical protein